MGGTLSKCICIQYYLHVHLKHLMVLFAYYTSLKLQKRLENLYNRSKHTNDVYLQVLTNILQYSLVSFIISILNIKFISRY